MQFVDWRAKKLSRIAVRRARSGRGNERFVPYGKRRCHEDF
jgi:hypothetical protein